jgi:hypothetical protein
MTRATSTIEPPRRLAAATPFKGRSHETALAYDAIAEKD